jgi:hypothetical protein
MQIDYLPNVQFEVQDHPGQAVSFAFGVRKSGSSILNQIVASLARMNGIGFVDVAGQLFKSGYPLHQWINDPALARIIKPGNLYGGFRDWPLALARDPAFAAARKVLLVRDPRDALVSEYFSNAYSHTIPESGPMRQHMLDLRAKALAEPIDRSVLNMATSFKRVLAPLLEFERLPNARLYRYEDVILAKAAWILDLCHFFGWSVTDPQIGQILGWADQIPTVEDPGNFIRRVIPGDHKLKLSAHTIAQLNTMFATEMAAFGYRPDD